MIFKTANVRFTVEGWHSWPEATGKREYLSQRHRHLFYIHVSIGVYHNEREIEYHDLLDFCKAKFPSGELGRSSCETLAENLINDLTMQWPGRSIQVSVFEDNEAGAVLAYVPH